MYYKHQTHIHSILLVIIILTLLSLASWLGYNMGLNASSGLGSISAQTLEAVKGKDVYLTPISLAENVKMQAATGAVKIDQPGGRIAVDVVLPQGVAVPTGSVLEAWLVDAGKDGGLGQTSVSDADRVYGTPFANIDFTAKVDSAPYAQSIGALKWDETRGTWHVFYSTNRNLTPYDAVMITVESDGDANNYNPRPGTPVLIGQIQ